MRRLNAVFRSVAFERASCAGADNRATAGSIIAGRWRVSQPIATAARTASGIRCVPCCRALPSRVRLVQLCLISTFELRSRYALLVPFFDLVARLQSHARTASLSNLHAQQSPTLNASPRSQFGVSLQPTTAAAPFQLSPFVAAAPLAAAVRAANEIILSDLRSLSPPSSPRTLPRAAMQQQQNQLQLPAAAALRYASPSPTAAPRSQAAAPPVEEAGPIG